MAEIKTKDIISFYKKMIDPLGYTIISKSVKQETDKFVPKDADKYGKMESIEIEKEMADVKAHIDTLEANMNKVKEKAINFMNTQAPTDYTKPMYTAMYAKNSIPKTAVKVVSGDHEGAKKLLNYLDLLRGEKLKEELTTKFNEKTEEEAELEIVKGMGSPELIIRI